MELKLSYMDTDSFIVYIKTQKIFTETWQNMLKQNFVPKIMNYIEHYLKEKIKNYSINER